MPRKTLADNAKLVEKGFDTLYKRLENLMNHCIRLRDRAAKHLWDTDLTLLEDAAIEGRETLVEIIKLEKEYKKITKKLIQGNSYLDR